MLRPPTWKAQGAHSRSAGHAPIHGRISGGGRDRRRGAVAAGRRGKEGNRRLSQSEQFGTDRVYDCHGLIEHLRLARHNALPIPAYQFTLELAIERWREGDAGNAAGRRRMSIADNQVVAGPCRTGYANDWSKVSR